MEKETKQKPQTQKGVDSKKDIHDNKTMAIIAYIVFFVPLLTDAKDSPFVKFHVKQSIVLVITWFLVMVLGSVIPIIGWLIIGPFGTIFVVVLWIMGLINATNGETKELPVIGKFGEQLFKF